MKLLKKIYPNGNKIYRIIFIVLSILFFLRLINIDADIPKFGMSLYHSIDEGAYSNAAINIYKYGSFLRTGEFFTNTGGAFKAILLGNALQVLTMKIFGNNYFGFRLPYFIFAFLNYILITIMIYKSTIIFCDSQKKAKIMSLVVMFYLLIDFPFLMASRYVENSIIRMLGNSIFLYIILIFQEKDNLKYFLCAFISGFFLFFSYFSNVSGIITMGILFIYYIICKEFQKAKKIFIYSLLGILLSIVLAEIAFIFIWRQEAFTAMYQGIFLFSDRLLSFNKDSNLLETIFVGLSEFFSANIFFYNPALLISGIIGVLACLYYGKKKKSEIHLISSFLILSYLLQCMVTLDWAIRKIIIILPAILLCVSLMVAQYRNYWRDKIQKLSLSLKVFIFSLIIFLTLFYIYASFQVRYINSFILDFTKRMLFTIWILNIVSIICCFSFLAILLFYYTNQRVIMITKAVNRNFKILSIIIFSCFSMISGFISIKHVYFIPYYSEKEAMIQLGKSVGNNYVVGGLAYGYSLYNDIKPMSGTLTELYNKFNFSNVNYILDYADAPYMAYKIVPPDSIRVKEVYPRIQTDRGSIKNMGLFEKNESYFLPITQFMVQ
ncbi:hypothetical protein PKF05_09100 [Fusobacterium simiae]|nr:hypothetical protein [Fusobacterium simiae]MDC7955981.1 hypothetical protein [Fusobacterium simiae]